MTNGFVGKLKDEAARARLLIGHLSLNTLVVLLLHLLVPNR